MNWRETQHGTHHLHKSRDTWATVSRCGNGAKLMLWYPDCGLTPDESMCESVAAAKAKAEQWIKTI